MFALVRVDVAARVSEVRQFLDAIRLQEVPAPGIDPPEVKIMRALFFVHLYAALEYSVNLGVQRLIQAMQRLNVKVPHFEPHLHSIVLDGRFNSLRNVGEDRRWTARSDLLSSQLASEHAQVDADIFYLYLQNIWIEKLEVLFKCLGIADAVVPDPRYRLYVDELVERRNGIAHGRFSALGIGGGVRVADLQQRLTAIEETIHYLIDCFDAHATSKVFIQHAHRATY